LRYAGSRQVVSAARSPSHGGTRGDASRAARYTAGDVPAEAERRLAHYGPNELPRAAPPSVALIFARQFKNPLVYLLLAATLVSLLVGELLDALFIFVVLLFNAGIGTLQEWRAQRKASELDSLVPHRAQVLRGGHWREIESARLVPGDVVRLESGSGVGADLRLLESRELLADESAPETAAAFPATAAPETPADVDSSVIDNLLGKEEASDSSEDEKT